MVLKKRDGVCVPVNTNDTTDCFYDVLNFSKLEHVSHLFMCVYAPPPGADTEIRLAPKKLFGCLDHKEAIVSLGWQERLNLC